MNVRPHPNIHHVHHCSLNVACVYTGAGATCVCCNMCFNVCMSACACLSVSFHVFGLRNSFLPDRQSELSLGRHVALFGCAVLSDFLLTFSFFYFFYFLPSEGTKWIFAAWLQPVMSLLPLAALAHAMLQCRIFFPPLSIFLFKYTCVFSCLLGALNAMQGCIHVFVWILVVYQVCLSLLKMIKSFYRGH